MTVFGGFGSAPHGGRGPRQVIPLQWGVPPPSSSSLGVEFGLSAWSLEPSPRMGKFWSTEESGIAGRGGKEGTGASRSRWWDLEGKRSLDVQKARKAGMGLVYLLRGLGGLESVSLACPIWVHLKDAASQRFLLFLPPSPARLMSAQEFSSLLPCSQGGWLKGRGGGGKGGVFFWSSSGSFQHRIPRVAEPAAGIPQRVG